MFDENSKISVNIIAGFTPILNIETGEIDNSFIGKNSPINMKIEVIDESNQVIETFNNNFFFKSIYNILINKNQNYIVKASLDGLKPNHIFGKNIFLNNPLVQHLNENNSRVDFNISILIDQGINISEIEDIPDIEFKDIIEPIEEIQEELVVEEKRKVQYPKSYYKKLRIFNLEPKVGPPTQIYEEPLAVSGFSVSAVGDNITDVGLGIQSGTYTLDITHGVFISSDATNSGGSYSITGTWEGGFGTGTFTLTGFWTGNSGGPTAINIADTIESRWTTVSSTLDSTSVNLIQNGGFGQSDKNILPAKIAINKSTGRWKIDFVQSGWHTYDRSRPDTKYYFAATSTDFNQDNFFATVGSQTGSFFDFSVGYYNLNVGLSGTIYGLNINIEASGTEYKTTKVVKDTTTITSPKVDKSIGIIPDVGEAEQELPSGISYHISPTTHIGRNILPKQTQADLFDSVNNIYTINNAPPGLINGVDYAIIPNTHYSKNWQYFYQLNASENAIELQDNGTNKINITYPEFPINEDAGDQEHWITGDANSSFELISENSYPISDFAVNYNQYNPVNKNMLLWAGQQHCGLFVGNPNDENLKKYLIY